MHEAPKRATELPQSETHPTAGLSFSSDSFKACYPKYEKALVGQRQHAAQLSMCNDEIYKSILKVEQLRAALRVSEAARAHDAARCFFAFSARSITFL